MNIDENRLRLASQRAFLGAISKPVLAICINLSGQCLTMTAFVEPNIDDEHREALEVALTEIYADYPVSATVDMRLVESEGQQLQANGIWVFLRFGCTVLS